MTTENPLALLSETALATTDDSFFSAVASSGKFLPRIQLMTSASEKCKAGEFPMNHYARVNNNDYRDLGATLDVLILAWRPLALKTGDEVISCYDVTSETFKSIQATADASSLSGCLYGPQFLFWVPSEGEFMTFFMASKTARHASVSVKALMHKPATLGSQKIENKDFTWYGPTCIACSTPFEMPSKEECEAQLEAFKNPAASEIEIATETDVRA